MHRPLRFALLLLLLGICGCGLSAYESKMEEEQDRLKYLDEESSSLDGPVDFPEVKEGKQVLIKKTDVFFRPPRGVHRKPDDKKPYGQLLNVYSGRAPFTKLFLAVSKSHKTEEDFRKEVLQSFGGGQVLTKRRVEQRAARPPRVVELQATKVEDPAAATTYVANFHKDREYMVAVIFALPSGEVSKANNLMDLSLATLSVGQRAKQQYAAFRSAAAPAPAPKAR